MLTFFPKTMETEAEIRCSYKRISPFLDENSKHSETTIQFKKLKVNAETEQPVCLLTLARKICSSSGCLILCADYLTIQLFHPLSQMQHGIMFA
jgi:hypothetical protein